MKYFITLGLVGLFTISSGDYMPESVFIDGQEYRPVQNDDRSTPSYSTPQEHCWYEQVPIPNSSESESPNVGGAIVGGIIGGVVGHQFGSGSGNTAATIAGAAIGTALGSKPQPAAQRYQTVRKCSTIPRSY